MTPARTALWRWVGAHGDAPLLDNASALSRMGIEPEARLLAPVPERPSVPTSSASPGGLCLPMRLALPPAPRVALPEGDTAAVQRRQVVDWLRELRAVAADLHDEGASPDEEPDATRKLDKLAMPAMVAALNAEDPQLRLVYAHVNEPDDRGLVPDNEGFGSSEWTQFMKAATPGRWRVVLDNSTHNLALDVRIDGLPGQPGRRGSIVHLSPSLAGNAEPLITAAQMASHLHLPDDWPLLLADVPAQKSLRSCRIFALSMALKCHKDASIDALHDQRLRGAPLPFATVPVEAELLQPAEYSSDDDSFGREGDGDDVASSDSESDADSSSRMRRDAGKRGASDVAQDRQLAPAHPAAPPQRQRTGLLGHYALDAADWVGLPFMKHAQSRNEVLAYLARSPMNPSDPVNRKGQTLLQRHDAHRVARWPQADARHSGPLMQSASIELKRITFLDKALQHAARCPPQEVQDLCAFMDGVDRRWRDRYRN